MFLRLIPITCICLKCGELAKSKLARDGQAKISRERRGSGRKKKEEGGGRREKNVHTLIIHNLKVCNKAADLKHCLSLFTFHI